MRRRFVRPLITLLPADVEPLMSGSGVQVVRFNVEVGKIEFEE